jgi:hypothetical protein
MRNLVGFGTGDAPPLAPLVGGFPASPKIKKNKIIFFFNLRNFGALQGPLNFEKRQFGEIFRGKFWPAKCRVFGVLLKDHPSEEPRTLKTRHLAGQNFFVDGPNFLNYVFRLR